MTKPFSQKNVRSMAAQVNRMAMRWPAFEGLPQLDGGTIWLGPLRGYQKFYQVEVYWNPRLYDRPLVRLVEPGLCPREGGKYEEIPHLIFDGSNPEKSALCLFDPEGREWTAHMLIADTTLPWAAQWLFYYELWHYDGKWRGMSIGPESVAVMKVLKPEQSTSQTGDVQVGLPPANDPEESK